MSSFTSNLRKIGRIYIVYVILGGLWVEIVVDGFFESLVGLDVDEILYILSEESDGIEHNIWNIIRRAHLLGIDNGDYMLALLLYLSLFLENLRSSAKKEKRL